MSDNTKRKIYRRLSLMFAVGIVCLGVALYQAWRHNLFWTILAFIVGMTGIITCFSLKKTIDSL